MAAPNSPSTSAAATAPSAFPSVQTEQPLVDSYTFHSVDKQSASGKGKEVLRAPVEGEWMLGVDEAGRGPVLGKSTRRLVRAVVQLTGLHLVQDHKSMGSHFASWNTPMSSSRWALLVRPSAPRRASNSSLRPLTRRFEDTKGS